MGKRQGSQGRAARTSEEKELTDRNFNDVQEAARRRAANTMSSETLARQIVAAAQGDARLAYEFMDVLNKHVTRMLQEKKP